MSRGSHHAGTSHRNPSSSATKNRGPKPNDNQPWERPRAATRGGTSGRGELMDSSSFRAFYFGTSTAEITWVMT